MKMKPLIAAIAALALFTVIGHAADITATGSGNWSSTVPDAPWPGGVVPGTNDDVDVESPFVITVETNAIIQYIYGSGTIVMSPGSTLHILGDPGGAQGTYQLANLDTSAANNTVIYSGNPFWAKHQNYFHLVFSNTVTTNMIDFYNGFVNSQHPAAAMTVAGDMSVIGKIKVQQGDAFTIGGNLLLGTNSTWDCSSFALTVMSNTIMGGLLLDLDGALGSNYFGGNLTVTPGSLGWNISDVIHWAIGGSLTNNGLIVGRGYGSIVFDGSGAIAGTRSIRIPTMTVNGTYHIANTITLATNTPTLNGTLIFDIARTNQIVLQSYPTNPLTLYYSGGLNVTNSGPPPSAGNNFRLFVATNYDGTFSSQTFPALPPGLSWVDNLVASGSITVIGSGATQPVITSYRYDPASHQATLIWTSEPSVTYSILYATDLLTGFNNVLATGIASGGATTTNSLALPNGNTGFIRIRQP